jgi:hypothetical protein
LRTKRRVKENNRIKKGTIEKKGEGEKEINRVKKE